MGQATFTEVIMSCWPETTVTSVHELTTADEATVCGVLATVPVSAHLLWF